MRWFNWRRATALIAIVAGIAVGTSAPASAATHTQHTNVTTQDAWW